MNRSPEFSFRTRAESVRRFGRETFDLLVIGGGITGAAVANDAVSRGLKVALVERRDFAFGTSSRSSKLIHGGLRYLQNFELGLVFEALAERAFLLETAPHMVKPLPFFLPVYEGDKHGKQILDIGLWLYDLLALFRAPGFHKRLSKTAMLEHLPYLKPEGLKGGFRYYDASMWDDLLAVETLRAASQAGCAIANYVEAIAPLWDGKRISGFRVRDLEVAHGKGEIDLQAHRVVVCAGPWADEIGHRLSPEWKRWLKPSKGVHILFDLKKLPVPGAVTMSHPQDGRIAFVIPRPDFGAGVTIVGTTDGPTPDDPGQAVVEKADVDYLLALLHRYFPKIDLTESDILSAYVGVRPLMGDAAGPPGNDAVALQKVSREHHIDHGPGGTVIVAGGKYTTHRTMAREIVDFTLKSWRHAAHAGEAPPLPTVIGHSRTGTPINPRATSESVRLAREEIARRGASKAVNDELVVRYGTEVIELLDLEGAHPSVERASPEGFPLLVAQFRHQMRTGMVMHLEDFYLRRSSFAASRADHGLPWADALARAWADERGGSESEVQAELSRLHDELKNRDAWRTKLR